MAHPDKKHPTTAAELDALTRAETYATLVAPVEAKLLKAQLRLSQAKLKKDINRLRREVDKLSDQMDRRVHRLLEGPPVPSPLEVSLPERFGKEPSI